MLDRKDGAFYGTRCRVDGGLAAMKCANCGHESPAEARFCGNCGSALTPAPVVSPSPWAAPSAASPSPSLAGAELADWGQRIGSWVIDFALNTLISLIPGVGAFLGLVPVIVNLVMYRRGNSIGLKLVGARIMRENGDVSGFFHTFVRSSAAFLSVIPLGLGYWWAFWDPMRQTWHDKMLHTYVMRDTVELRSRKGTSSTTAVILFWVFVVGMIALIVLAIVAALVLVGIYGGRAS